MPVIIPSKEVEKILRAVLSREGYAVSEPRQHGELGADIVARKGEKALHIEAISFRQPGPARSRDFYEVFFRAISRLKNDATDLVIALPSRFENGLRKRVAAAGPAAWYRIGDAFPELEIWLVNTTDGSLKRTKWNSWSKF